MHKLTRWLNFPARMYFLLLSSVAFVPLEAQHVNSVTLEEAYHAAESNFPLIKQRALFQQTESLTIKNLNSIFLPQLNVSGQATYQSDVTRVDIPLPGIKVSSLSRDQYKVTADVSQLLYDGGQLKGQRDLQLLNTRLDESRLAVDIYQVKNRVSQLYFGVLYNDALLKQSELVIHDLQIGVDKIQPQVENKTLLRSNLQVLEVQLLQNRQRLIEIKAMRKGLTDALSILTNLQLDEATSFVLPLLPAGADQAVTRPELSVYLQQAKLANAQLKLIRARNKPRASDFVQGGYGKPALNMLSNDFDLFYIAGIRLNWSLGGLYNNMREKKLVDLSSQSIQLQKENFLLNISSRLQQLRAEINKFRELVTSDEQIIQLRNKITESAKVQLENAVITANDYLREVNAADLARQALATHQLQLLQAEVNYLITSGKL